MARKFFKKCMNMENGVFDGVGQYGIPQLKGIRAEDFNPNTTWFNFISAVSQKKDRKKYSVHFFIDDYQFERCWNALDTYTALLSQYNYVLTPDFSLYLDMPKAIQIYNRYRSHYLGAYWESKGIKVIPTVSWSDKSSYEWCFDGVPKHSVVATSTMGALKDDTSRRIYLNGYREMKKRLEPSGIISYGTLPEEWREKDILFLEIPPFYKSTVERSKMQKAIKKAFSKEKR